MREIFQQERLSKDDNLEHLEVMIWQLLLKKLCESLKPVILP
jgi:hypothetical protein